MILVSTSLNSFKSTGNRQVRWTRRPKMLEKYRVKTLYCPNYEKLHSKHVPIEQVSNFTRLAELPFYNKVCTILKAKNCQPIMI